MDFESAKKWYQKCRQEAKNIGDLSSQALASHTLGLIAANQGDVAEAWKCYQEALEIYQSSQNLREIADIWQNMGEMFISMGAYDLAKDLLIKSVRVAENIGYEWLVAANYHALGKLSEAQHDFTSAKDWFAKALSMFAKLGDDRNAAASQTNLGRVTYAAYLGRS